MLPQKQIPAVTHVFLLFVKAAVVKGNPKYGACLRCGQDATPPAASQLSGDYQCNNAMTIFKEHGTGWEKTLVPTKHRSKHAPINHRHSCGSEGLGFQTPLQVAEAIRQGGPW